MGTLLPLLLAALSSQTQGSNIQVIELFRAETPEDLRSALADGYPMPWLAQILADTTIPEEDRYWLDCRMRAAIAQDLHLFYDRDGKAVFVQADWIAPGEDYWRESFIVNPPGEWPSGEISSETGLWGEAGSVYNLYGDRIGALALCEEWMTLSRDGSTGALFHRGSENVSEMGPIFLFIVYADGSYFKLQRELWTYDFALSQNGQNAALVIREMDGSNQIVMLAKNGDVLWEEEAAGMVVVNRPPVFSPDARLCAIPSIDPSSQEQIVQVFDVDSGTEEWRATGVGPDVFFTASGDYVMISGLFGACFLAATGNEVWRTNSLHSRGMISYNPTCSNDLNTFALCQYNNARQTGPANRILILDADGSVVLSSESLGGCEAALSPSGSLALWRSSRGMSNQAESSLSVVQLGSR